MIPGPPSASPSTNTRPASRAAPGPRGGFLLGSVRALARDGLAFYERLARDYPTVARFRLGPYRMFLVNDPALVRDVLLHDVERFHKGFGNRVLKPLLGDGLFLAEGEDWREKRKLVQPLFKRDHVADMTSLVVDVSREVLDRWRPGETVDVFPALREITLRVVSRALVGSDAFDAPESRRVLEWLWVETNRRLSRGVPWLDRLPLPSNLRHRDQLAALDAIVEGLTNAPREGAARVDLLALLADARTKGGAMLSTKSMRDEVVTMLLAGHECTAIAAAWTLHLLATHPEVTAWLREELASVLGGRDPQPDDLGRLVRLRQVLDESMRLYPPAWIVARDADKDLEIGGYRIPRGSTVLVSAWTLHRDPRFWKDPAAFVPARFAPDAPPPVPGSYLPFGIGPRTCVGRPFAIPQALVILAMALTRFDFTPIPGHVATPDPGLTLRPRTGLPLHLESTATP